VNEMLFAFLAENLPEFVVHIYPVDFSGGLEYRRLRSKFEFLGNGLNTDFLKDRRQFLLVARFRLVSQPPVSVDRFRQQFLFESILISLIGAAFGVVLGVIVGNVFSLVLNTGFVVPWEWLLGGIFICSLVGLLAGLYPSLKASRLNPIEALRYE